jgi:hypothetical protein
MLELSSDHIIELILKEKTFEACQSEGIFSIKIDEYSPYLCAAIHNGHQLRKGLEDKILLNEFERWQEEDPCTAQFVTSLPIVIAGNDSRYEYDLNRSPENCIYDEAWGKKVWGIPLTKEQKDLSLHKHREFYRVLQALLEKLESKFAYCLVYDIHSYNYHRYDRETPLFNLGTDGVDTQKFRKFIDHWQQQLGKITIPGIVTKAAINDVFRGQGYLTHFVSSNFANALALATEIKKVYCNELTGEEFPQIIDSLAKQMAQAILNDTDYFTQHLQINSTNYNFKNSWDKSR